MKVIIILFIAFCLTSWLTKPQTPLAVKREIASTRIDVSSLGWKLTFEDEFDDPATAIQKGVDPECFTKTPQCLYNSWVIKDCKPQYHANLRNLNKCIWVAYDQYSWMDFQAPPNKGVNVLQPDQIEVKDGVLNLYADKNKNFIPPKDCGVEKHDPEVSWTNKTKNCETAAGMIMSRPYAERNQQGFAQEFGRFEVRAKLLKGPGSWSAHWLLPVESNVYDNDGNKCGWPFDGEIDIMEQWAKDRDYRNYKAGIYTGDCKKSIQSGDGGWYKGQSDLTENFHTYAVEWTKEFIRFTLDDEEVALIRNGESFRSQYIQVPGKTNFTEKELEKRFQHKINIPTGPFYYLLTSSIEGVSKEAPDFSQPFIKQTQAIDYVRVYRRCTPKDDPQDCKQIKIKSKGVDGYNSSKGETAFAQLNAYPNPFVKGNSVSDVTIRLKLEQNCSDVDIELYNILGQRVHALSNQGGDQILKDVALEGNQDYYYQLYPDNLQAGLYFIHANFRECGNDRSGKGNQVFKLVVQ